ncbi:DUF418 domain-containing protein [Streptomyces sp. NPDC013953]|uniref:DUF418 domain-containing protein n=1 Tax=Streptomyces sp. NPDC013953 TaxID=3364868 RepID=UPI0036F71C40
MTQDHADIPAQPVAARPAAGRRILEVDALRGFALGGILLVNILVMSGTHGRTAADPAVAGADLVAHWLVTALVETKFYLLFSFLFGYSFSLQEESAQRAGAPFVPRMLRRLLGLFVLGALHMALLYSGDILTMYAVLGLVLLLVRNAAAERLRRAARWVYAVPIGLLFLLGALAALAPEPGPSERARTAGDAARLAAGMRGDAADVVAANLSAWPDAVAALLFAGGSVVAAFLAGLVAGRRHLLTGGTAGPARLRRTRTIGLAVGLPGGIVMAAGTVAPLPERWEVLCYTVGLATAPALTAAYASALMLWFAGSRGARAAALLAPAGRMALTNYLCQSVVMALLFTGYGLGLYGRAGAAAAVAAALALYAAQLFVSPRVLGRFRQGPVEWLLRTVTLGRTPRNSGMWDGGPSGPR